MENEEQERCSLLASKLIPWLGQKDSVSFTIHQNGRSDGHQVVWQACCSSIYLCHAFPIVEKDGRLVLTAPRCHRQMVHMFSTSTRLSLRHSVRLLHLRSSAHIPERPQRRKMCLSMPSAHATVPRDVAVLAGV